MRVTLCLICCLVAGTVFPQDWPLLPATNKTTLDGPVPKDAANPVCGAPVMTAAFIRQAVENTRIFKPELYALMQKAKLEKSFGVTADTVGSLRAFFVPNRVTFTFDRITARLRAKGALTQVWVDTTELNNQHVTQTEVNAMLRALEDQTPPASRDPNRGIIELDNEIFGNPPNIDSDGLTDFLIVDIKDGWQPGQGSFIAGFFTSNDQFPGAAGSNARDLLYIDSFPTIFSNDRRTVGLAVSVLAHEYQHLIHYNYDKDETGFVNEGLSELAMLACGYQAESPVQYLGNPDTPLFNWNNEAPDYSRAALFTLYYHEQFGDAILQQVIQDAGNNDAGLRNVFARAGSDLNQVIENWHLANYLQDRNVDTKYGYKSPIGSLPREAQNHSDPNQNRPGEVVQSYAADYIAFSFGDSLKATFLSGAPLNVKAIKLGAGLKQIVDVPLGAPYAVPEFGNAVSKVVFAVINRSAVAAIYSYNAQGKPKGVLVEAAYDDGTPDIFTANASFLGFGNDSKGFGWAVKFTPEIPANQLVAAKLLVVFDQEFQGSSTPANAPKDFLFHVWRDNNGLPGSDMIAPFLVSTDRRSTNGREFLNIDLSPHAAALKNLGPVYIGFTEDDDDTVGTNMGMDNSAGTSYTYAFFGPAHPTLANRWVPMANLRVGQTSLATWNMMMRATFTYNDPTTPKFAVGYFQNPIFSERLDVFAVSRAALNRANLSATLTQNTVPQSLFFVPVPNAGDRVFVDQNVTLNASGAMQIRVRGTTKYGFAFADTAVTFNVQFLQSNSGGALAATDGKMKVAIPGEALRDDIYVIAANGNSEVLNVEIESALTNPFSAIYSVSPIDYALAKPALLQIKIDRRQLGAVSPLELAIARWDAKKWVALNSTLAGDFISAETSKLGHFVLVRKDNATEVSSAAQQLPSRFELHQNYPNPFNPSANIRFDLPEKSFVVLKVYDIFGRELRALANEQRSPGSHLVTWDGRDNLGRQVSSGIYFYQLTAGKFSKTMKMILTK